ncbi:MAG: hypothetical protein JSV03_15815, partial [Planctomycetota bacterium]
MVNNDRSQENSIQQNQDQNLTQFLTLGLNVTGLPCLVVGGGKIGTRKALLLAEKGAPVTILAPEITELAQKKVADGIILWQSSKYARQALQGFFLVVAATNNLKLNLQIGRDAEDLGLLYCITSAGQDSRIIFPAVFEHGQITVAVHSQGQDPQYSIRTRDKISEVLTSKSKLKPDQHASAIPDDQAIPDQGKVYIIGAGPGAPDLITLRGLKTIQDA